MTGPIGYFARHATAANLLMALILLGGVIAGGKLRSQYLPDFIVERLTVTVLWPGAGPEDVDRAIVAELEPSLRALDGVESTRSVARQGRAVITVEFEERWDMSRAVEEAGAAVEAVKSLPDAAERPVIARVAFREKVTDVLIHGPVGAPQLSRYADELQTRLFDAGIARTTLLGVQQPVIRVEAQEATLVRHDLSLREIAAAIGAGADSRPAGELGLAAPRVRSGENRRRAEEIAAIPVRALPGGERLLVRDVATVRLEGVEAGRAFFFGEEPAVLLRIDRDADGDAIAIQKKTEEIAAKLAPTLPKGVSIRLTEAPAEEISDRLNLLLANAAEGLAIVLALLFLFLSLFFPFLVAIGLPVSFAAAVVFMWAAGVTINMVSLFALIVCLGIVVDDAIVVGEHADRLASEGAGPEAAATFGAARMAAPVLAATVTTIIAFAGITFVSGRFGAMVLDVPLTVIAVLAASTIECFLILPAHMRHALAGRARASWVDAPSRAFNRGFDRFRRTVFRPLMRFVISIRWVVVAGAISLTLHSLTLFLDGDVKWRFWAAPELRTVDANIAMAPGATRSDTAAQLREMRAALERTDAEFRAEHGVGGLDYAIAQIGGSAGWRGLPGAEGKDPDLLGGLSVTLIDPDLRPFSQSDFVAAWEQEILRLPRLETLSIRAGRRGPGEDSIAVNLTGADPAVLKRAAEALKRALGSLPGVGGLEDSLSYDKTELSLRLTPRAEALGLTDEALGQALRDRLSGIDAAEFLLDGRTAKVNVSLAEAELGPDHLDRATIRTPDGRWARLSELVDVEPRSGFSMVRREDGRATLAVTGDLSEDDPAIAAAATEAIRDRILPEIEARFDVTAERVGLAEQERSFLSDATLGFIFCVSGVYLVLAWIFGSWSRPLVIVLAIPFGIVGALWGHYWNGLALSLFSVVGLIGMSGIIVNDSIVLVTAADEHAARRAIRPALVEAASDRLRAVLLTTLTTIGGLAPLLFERSQQALFLKPTVVTLVYGLAFGMVLVLFVTPAMIAIQHDLGAGLRAFRRMARRRRRRGLARAVSAPARP